VDEEAVLVDLRTNEIFALNPTAARVWELLEEGHGLTAIVERLTREFDVSSELARSEATRFVELLEREGLTTADQPG
jgi:hypothetical protein